MKTAATAAMLLALVSLTLAGCESLAKSSEDAHGESGEHERKVVVTTPFRKDVISTQQYVCQIHSCQHIEVCAKEGGYLDEIHIQEGQSVTKGYPMFKIRPIVLQAELDAEIAEANRIRIELNNAKALLAKHIVAPPEIALKEAELARAEARVELARAKLSFTDVVAPFDGIVDRQLNQLGSLIEEGDVLTTLSDNSTMWVYFNVPEARYFEYKSELDKGVSQSHLEIELKLANGEIFSPGGKVQKGKIGAIEADFDNTTGNIFFRADFPNPNALLRNGQTGTILIHRPLKNALIIPQRAVFDILAKQYVYVVGDDDVVHQRDITVDSVLDDIYVISDGLKDSDKIIFEGVRQVRDGDKIEYEFRPPQEVLSKENLKFPAE